MQLITQYNVKYKVLKTHDSYKHKQIMSVFRANIEDQKKRAHFAKHELQKIVIQTLNVLNPNVRVTASQKLKFEKLKCLNLSTHKMCGPTLRLIKQFNKKYALKKSSFALIRNRCILSGRSTIVGKFRLSRINFRHYAHYAKIVGVSKCVNN